MDEFARFARAQEPVWTTVLAELRLGRKRTHWMWFVFPQLAALGRSENSRFFGIEDIEHARRFLAHPILGPRLIEVTELVLDHAGTPMIDIFGGIDAQKFRSSMTLFEQAGGQEPFGRALDTFCDGERCPLTEAILSQEPEASAS